MEKAALITGSSRGIGKAIALKLAKKLPVVVHCHYDVFDAQAVLDEVVANGGRGIALAADVSDPDAVEGLFAKIKESGYWTHTLVNNAGITRDQIVALMKQEDWKLVLDTNLSGAFYCVKSAVGSMISHKSGSIIKAMSQLNSGLYYRHTNQQDRCCDENR